MSATEPSFAEKLVDNLQLAWNNHREQSVPYQVVIDARNDIIQAITVPRMDAKDIDFVDRLIQAFKDSVYQQAYMPTSPAFESDVKKAEADLRQALTVPMVDAEDDFLRDQFAMAALQGLIQLSGTTTIPQECSDAYRYADEMMIARKGNG